VSGVLGADITGYTLNVIIIIYDTRTKRGDVVPVIEM